MKKGYCTQNNGKCETCSLVNYGRDCINNPIAKPAKPVKKLKGYNAAMASYKGHHGPVTIAAVMKYIPEELKKKLTGHELGLVMSAVNDAYHKGRGSHGGLDLCDDAVWFPWGGETKTHCTACQTGDPSKCICINKVGSESGQLIPIAVIRRITIESVPPPTANPAGYKGGRRYKLNETEYHG